MLLVSEQHVHTHTNTQVPVCCIHINEHRTFNGIHTMHIQKATKNKHSILT